MSHNSPRWYNGENTKGCDHDTDEWEPLNVKSFVGYSDFAYYRDQCGHPECEETWDWYISG